VRLVEAATEIVPTSGTTGTSAQWRSSCSTSSPRTTSARSTSPLQGPGAPCAGLVSATCSEDSDDGLDRLFSEELHDLAIAYARKHHDVRLLVRLMETLPAAEAAAGEVGNMEADVMQIGAHIDDVTDSGRAETAWMLRPCTSTTSGATAPRRRERAPGSVAITQKA
jgi:hypothetical protein